MDFSWVTLRSKAPHSPLHDFFWFVPRLKQKKRLEEKSEKGPLIQTKLTKKNGRRSVSRVNVKAK